MVKQRLSRIGTVIVLLAFLVAFVMANTQKDRSYVIARERATYLSVPRIADYYGWPLPVYCRKYYEDDEWSPRTFEPLHAIGNLATAAACVAAGVVIYRRSTLNFRLSTVLTAFAAMGLVLANWQRLFSDLDWPLSLPLACGLTLPVHLAIEAALRALSRGARRLSARIRT